MTDSHLRDRRGNRYATPELAHEADTEIGRYEADRAARAKAEADTFEATLKQAYLAQPGTSEESWARNRQQLLDEANRKAVIAADDAARQANAARYQ